MTPLHEFGELLRYALSAIPMVAVRLLFLAFLATVGLWVLMLPRAAVTPDGESPPRRGSNLKFWALTALAIQFVIYCLL